MVNHMFSNTPQVELTLTKVARTAWHWKTDSFLTPAVGEVHSGNPRDCAANILLILDTVNASRLLHNQPNSLSS